MKDFSILVVWLTWCACYPGECGCKFPNLDRHDYQSRSNPMRSIPSLSTNPRLPQNLRDISDGGALESVRGEDLKAPIQ
jgi:hypothetical protein